MDDTVRREFGALLHAQRDELLAGVGASERLLDAIREARSDTPADDEHDPEGGTMSAEWSRAEGLLEGTQRELGELDAALARLAAGSYGICTGCGSAIPLERLRVRPAALQCVGCASASTRVRR